MCNSRRFFVVVVGTADVSQVSALVWRTPGRMLRLYLTPDKCVFVISPRPAVWMSSWLHESWSDNTNRNRKQFGRVFYELVQIVITYQSRMVVHQMLHQPVCSAWQLQVFAMPANHILISGRCKQSMTKCCLCMVLKHPDLFFSCKIIDESSRFCFLLAKLHGLFFTHCFLMCTFYSTHLNLTLLYMLLCMQF